MKPNPIRYIYESPDKGKTVYRRPFGKLEPKELVEHPLLEKNTLSLLRLPFFLQN